MPPWLVSSASSKTVKKLPEVEFIAPLVHEAWIQRNLSLGIVTRKAVDGEELMAPWTELTEHAKDNDRHCVQTVYGGIEMFSGEDVD
jgi:hypothetical protein